MKTIPALGILFLLILTVGCRNRDQQIDETPTRGNIRIAADESFQPLVNAEIQTFHAQYAYAMINPLYKPETDVVALLMQDSVRMIVVSRDLTQAEKDQLLAGKIIARPTKIAYDAVAFILNKDNENDKLRYDQIEGLMNGSLSRWDQVNPATGLGKVVVVFDNNKSGNFRFLQERFLKGKPLPEQLYAVESNPEVINYVKTNRDAIGIIGLNWISDHDNSQANTFLQEIKVAAIGEEGDIEGVNEFKKPYQAYLADGSYPFTREVYAIGRESFVGLGSGFIQFLAGDIGQRIILKAGLVPATMPVRLVQFKK